MKNNSTSTKKPFCKVCFDAGKESAHPLRNAVGQTVCTYLLSLRCNNCRKSGHTVKYCKEPKKFIQQQQQTPTARMPAAHMHAVQIAPPKQEKPKEKTRFDVFQKLIQEEEKEAQRESEELAQRLKEIEHKTNFPDISEKRVTKKASDSILTGWSQIAGKPIKVYETISEEQAQPSKKEEAQPSKKEEAQPSKKEEAQPQTEYSSDFSAYSGKSWADWD
jgi:hypothetical protein